MVHQDFYITLQNALKSGLSKQDLRRIMKERNLGVREMNMLLRGKMDPFKFSESRFRKRVKDAKRAYPDENINSSFFFPRREFIKIMREYRNKSLKPIEPEVRQEVEETEGPSVIDRLKNMIPSGITGQQSRAPTPPLPQTPQPTVQMTNNMQQKNPITNLTRTETALLSPTEKVIAGRT